MQARSGELKELNARFLPVSCDEPGRNTRVREKLGLDFQMLSDPHVTLKDRLGIKTSSHHPKAWSYPEGQFLQPGLVIWDEQGEKRFEWFIQPKLTNLFGAARRMTPDEVMEKVRSLL